MEASARRRSRPIGETVPNNLPHYLTRFVGRRTDLSALKSMLAHSRMVTLTGPGGGGKSRLAVELVGKFLYLWADGVWWVELAPVNDAVLVAGAVVTTLELPGRGPAQDVAIAWLAARRSLLILDNCEHLIGACAEFCQAALESCAELTILATSREALGVPGEAHWPVSSLREADAANLFEVRAALVQPSFRVTASNRHRVTEICGRVDRLPLAIELAAARVGMMTEQEILSQLTDRFRLLRGGSRTAPERLQAMDAAIDWSYRLLTKEEATLFRRLSVFRGGFTLESVHAICVDGMTASVLDLIAGLVQKSMVMVERTDGSGSRYRLLESQLAFAEDRQREADELEVLRRRHYEYFKDGLSARTTSYMGLRARRPGFDDAQWVARESGNLWAAMAWARKNTDDLGIGLATDLALNRSGDFTQLRSLLDELLSRSPEHGRARVHALGAAFNIAYRQGDHEAALAYAEAEVALARDLEDIEEVAQALHFEGIALTWRGEFAKADEVFAEAMSLLKDSPNHRLLNFIRTAIAYLLVQSGDCTTAGNILGECLATTRAQGDVSRTAYHLDIFASAQLGLNEPRAAAASWKEALHIQRGLKKQLGMIDSLIGLSRVAAACRDDRRAVRLAAAADRLSGEMSYAPDPWMLLQLESSRRGWRERLGVRLSEKAWNEGWSMSLDRAADYALDESEFEAGFDASPLSRREREVASLVGAGLTNRQIGERLFISWRTVEGHVERIRNKLNARSRTQVATWAVGRGLVTSQVTTEPGPAEKPGTRNSLHSIQRQ